MGRGFTSLHPPLPLLVRKVKIGAGNRHRKSGIVFVRIHFGASLFAVERVFTATNLLTLCL